MRSCSPVCAPWSCGRRLSSADAQILAAFTRVCSASHRRHTGHVAVRLGSSRSRGSRHGAWPAQMHSRRKIAPGQSLWRQWRTPHPQTPQPPRCLRGGCAVRPCAVGEFPLLGRNGFRRWPISPSVPTVARRVRICGRCPRRECRRTGTRGYRCQRSWHESWPAGSRR